VIDCVTTGAGGGGVTCLAAGGGGGGGGGVRAPGTGSGFGDCVCWGGGSGAGAENAGPAVASAAQATRRSIPPSRSNDRPERVTQPSLGATTVLVDSRPRVNFTGAAAARGWPRPSRRETGRRPHQVRARVAPSDPRDTAVPFHPYDPSRLLTPVAGANTARNRTGNTLPILARVPRAILPSP
jgi:hypothetical protein